MKYWLGLMYLVVTTVNAIPFDFKYGQSKESVPYPFIDRGLYKYCKLTDYAEFNTFFISWAPTEYDLMKKVRANYKKLGISIGTSINDLKNTRTMNLLIDYPFPMLGKNDDDLIKGLAWVKDKHQMTEVYKRKKYIFEKLVQEDVFKDFSNYKIKVYQFETIVYELPRMKVCAHFKNNALVQIGFSKEGAGKDFDRIVNAITSKYKGSFKIYDLKKPDNRAAICGSGKYIDNISKCFLKVYSTSTDSGEIIKANYNDKSFKPSFFGTPYLENDLSFKFPLVNYLDKGEFFHHKELIEIEQSKFNTLIMKKLYLRLQELFEESKNLKTGKDEYLDQF